MEHNNRRWYGKVHRSKERLTKILLKWTPKGIQRRGRPRMTWKTSIKESSKASKLGNVNCPEDIEMAKNSQKYFYWLHPPTT